MKDPTAVSPTEDGLGKASNEPRGDTCLLGNPDQPASPSGSSSEDPGCPCWGIRGLRRPGGRRDRRRRWRRSPGRGRGGGTRVPDDPYQEILRGLRCAMPWLETGIEHLESADSLVALIASLSARCAARDFPTRHPSRTYRTSAARVGFICRPASPRDFFAPAHLTIVADCTA